MEKFTCWGSNRGGCGVKHKTIRTALKCCWKDDDACLADPSLAHPGRYTDRDVYHADKDGKLMKRVVDRDILVAQHTMAEAEGLRAPPIPGSGGR